MYCTTSENRQYLAMMKKPKEDSSRQKKTLEQSITLINNLGFNLCVTLQSLVMRLVAYFRVKGSRQNKGSKKVEQKLKQTGIGLGLMTLIFKLREYTVTTQYLQEVQNRRRVVYYTILLIIISEKLLEEINYIIVRFSRI